MIFTFLEISTFLRFFGVFLDFGFPGIFVKKVRFWGFHMFSGGGPKIPKIVDFWRFLAIFGEKKSVQVGSLLGNSGKQGVTKSVQLGSLLGKSLFENVGRP